MAESVHVVERLVNWVSAPLPDGSRYYQYEVLFHDIGGPWGSVYPTAVNIASVEGPPSGRQRAAAYRALVAGLPGAENTLPEAVYAYDLLPEPARPI